MTIRQAGLQSVLVTGKYAAYSKATNTEGVVIAVRFIDDALNLSKTFVEYDVRDLRTSQIYSNCRRMDIMCGMDDGSEDILRPAQQLIGALSPLFDPKVDPLSQSDGDRVTLTFTYGAQHGATIIGVLPHAKMTYGTTKEQGARRFQTHKGTSVETKKDGTYVIKRNDTSITLNADESIVVKHKSGSTMRFLDNGDIDVVPHRQVLLGDEQLSELSDGVVHGTGIDTFSGQMHWQLGSTSRKVLAKK